MPAFEVYKKCGRGWSYKGIQRATDSARAAGLVAFAHGPGTYKVRPEDSRDTFFKYRIAPFGERWSLKSLAIKGE